VGEGDTQSAEKTKSFTATTAGTQTPFTATTAFQ